VSLSNKLSEKEYPNYDIVFSLDKTIKDHYIVKKTGSIFTKLFFSKKYAGLNLTEMEKNDFLVLTSKETDGFFDLKIHHQDKNQPTKKLHIRPRIISNDSKIIKEAVISGLGIGILPGHAVSEELKTGLLEEAFYSHYVYNDDVYAIYSSFLMMPKLFRAFLDFVSVELSIDLQINPDSYCR
jgi:hypothetical protein